VQYTYSITADQFILKWQSQNAVGVTLDDRQAPLDGEQAFPLQTHTFVLTATGGDGSQSVHVIAFVMTTGCTALVNGQQTQIPGAQCSAGQTQAQATATTTPATTTTQPDTATPQPPTPASPPPATPTAVPSPTTAAGMSAGDGGAGMPATATATPDLGLPTFPTDTPTPTFTTGQ
jgi:hypothetical protein